ncbi:hypothetical protein P389DRAFT_173393 [Cystobasidium minutum MCA 4210]|uniref:uncharacterized protein n=1 Tax=Cystobasidium minutum MCA 4210 TaxID=1397322 RepID=UPI0034CD4CFF|eukprot:jgi/Rhomi1/173393/fgenesh1_kg.6_\
MYVHPVAFDVCIGLTKCLPVQSDGIDTLDESSQSSVFKKLHLAIFALRSLAARPEEELLIEDQTSSQMLAHAYTALAVLSRQSGNLTKCRQHALEALQYEPGDAERLMMLFEERVIGSILQGDPRLKEEAGKVVKELQARSPSRPLVV